MRLQLASAAVDERCDFAAARAGCSQRQARRHRRSHRPAAQRVEAAGGWGRWRSGPEVRSRGRSRHWSSGTCRRPSAQQLIAQGSGKACTLVTAIDLVDDAEGRMTPCSGGSGLAAVQGKAAGPGRQAPTACRQDPDAARRASSAASRKSTGRCTSCTDVSTPRARFRYGRQELGRAARCPRRVTEGQGGVRRRHVDEGRVRASWRRCAVTSTRRGATRRLGPPSTTGGWTRPSRNTRPGRPRWRRATLVAVAGPGANDLTRSGDLRSGRHPRGARGLRHGDRRTGCDRGPEPAKRIQKKQQKAQQDVPRGADRPDAKLDVGKRLPGQGAGRCREERDKQAPLVALLDTLQARSTGCARWALTQLKRCARRDRRRVGLTSSSRSPPPPGEGTDGAMSPKGTKSIANLKDDLGDEVAALLHDAPDDLHDARALEKGLGTAARWGDDHATRCAGAACGHMKAAARTAGDGDRGLRKTVVEAASSASRPDDDAPDYRKSMKAQIRRSGHTASRAGRPPRPTRRRRSTTS